MRSLASVACFLGVLLSGRQSIAAPPGALAFGYDAPWECPDRGYFWQELRSRSARLSSSKPCDARGQCLASDGAALENVAASVTAEVSVRRLGEGYAGTVRLRDAAGVEIERHVSGQVCVDVTRALALATAVALDASLEQSQPAGSVPQQQKEMPFEYSVGAAFGIHTAAQPSLALTLGLAAAVRARRVATAPMLRFEALFALPSKVWDATHQAQARFSWFATRTSVCSFPARSGMLELGPCGFVELGALRGEGLTGLNTQTQTGLWFAPGLLLLGALRHESLGGRLAVGGVVPVSRDRFLFGPEFEVFHPPSVGLVAELELSWVFDG